MASPFEIQCTLYLHPTLHCRNNMGFIRVYHEHWRDGNSANKRINQELSTLYNQEGAYIVEKVCITTILNIQNFQQPIRFMILLSHFVLQVM